MLPYCRKCGAKLEEDARFCLKCGTPVATYSYAPSAKPRSIRKDPMVIGGIILVAILISAVVITAIIFTPIQPFNFGQTNNVVNKPNVNTLNLNFEADNAQVNIIIQNFTEDAVVLYTSGTGSVGVGSKNPVQIVFNNETVGNTLTVSAKVTTPGFFTAASKITCDIHINPSLSLNLNVTTNNGQVTLMGNQSATFEALNLKSNSGLVQANIEKGSVIAGDISLKTTTGTVMFQMNQANVQGNNTVNLQATTGALDMDITENQTLSGNIQVNAATTTGAVNLALDIDNSVAAKITSQTQIGSINTNLNNFSGNKSPIQSNNYPSESNFQISLKTTIGSINVNAAYQSASAPSLRN